MVYRQNSHTPLVRARTVCSSAAGGRSRRTHTHTDDDGCVVVVVVVGDGGVDMCFQLLGFDILLDDEFRPYLLEINQSPSIAAETALDLNIKQRLLETVFTILGYLPATSQERAEWEQRASIKNGGKPRPPPADRKPNDPPHFDVKPGDCQFEYGVITVGTPPSPSPAAAASSGDDTKRSSKRVAKKQKSDEKSSSKSSSQQQQQQQQISDVWRSEYPVFYQAFERFRT